MRRTLAIISLLIFSTFLQASDSIENECLDLRLEASRLSNRQRELMINADSLGREAAPLAFRSGNKEALLEAIENVNKESSRIRLELDHTNSEIRKICSKK